MKALSFAPNQIVWKDGDVEYFQSYDSIIVKKEKNGIITLDKKFWNFSRTTSKYRSMYLEESKAETERKIKDGVYKLDNLNQ